MQTNNPDDSSELQEELTEASIDSAEEASMEHDRERDADHRQGLIERETRRHHLDEG